MCVSFRPHALTRNRPPSSQMSWERGSHVSADDAHCLELFGFGAALDCYAAQRTAGPVLRVRRLTVGKESSQGVDGTENSFARVREAMVQEWRRTALRELPAGSVRQGSEPWTPFPRVAGDGTDRNGVGVVAHAVAPTPSDILTASSIRMMLSMASAFRRSNPAVLQAMCGTLLELLLETPPLALAPLHRVPTSIESSTFRKVGDFCAELIGSSDPAGREPALGLFLALAVSQGTVSDLLEVVTCLLDCCRQSPLAVRRSDGASAVPVSSVSGVSAAECAAVAGATDLEQDRFSEHEAGVSAVLDRLANHRIDLDLSFPDECDGMRFVINVPARPATTCSGDGNASLEPCVTGEGIEWGCPASAATDGRFVYAWHPDIGLLKAGTGLSGTTKGRLYAENSGAGRPDMAGKNGLRREGFVAVIGDKVYLQAGGCTSPHRFLVARSSDLAIEGRADAPGLALPVTEVSPPTMGARTFRCRCPPPVADGEIEPEHVGREDVGAPADDGSQEDFAPPAPYVPLCCDGRLVYALVPLEGTARPSVVAVDLAKTGRVTGPPIALQRPRSWPMDNATTSSAGQSDERDLPTVNADGDSVPRTRGSSGPTEIGGNLSDSTAAGEWPWWENGRGATAGVRTYCNGDRLVVCWLDDAQVAAPAESTTSTWRDRAARAGVTRGVVVSSQDSVASSTNTDVRRITHMARFRLSTGACEPVENNAALSGSWLPRPPCLGYDSSCNLIMRCSLRRPLPVPSSPRTDHGGVAVVAELHVCLWRNCGLAPGPCADGPFGWKGVLRTLAPANPARFDCYPAANDAEGAQSDCPGYRTPGVSAMSRVAVFVLAHLDRLGAHYLGSGGNKRHAEETGASSHSEVESSSVPFCYDLAPATFRHLCRLVETCAGPSGTALFTTSFDENGAGGTDMREQLRLYALCASLRVLNVNMGILLSRGLGVAEFGGEALRQSLLRCLLGLVKEYVSDCAETAHRLSTYETVVDANVGQAAAATEALQLVVDGMDLFYPTQQRQARLLSAYLRAYRANGGSQQAAVRAITLELLARVSSMRFLRSLEAASGPDSASGMSTETEYVGPGLNSSGHYYLASDEIGGLTKDLVDLSTVQCVLDVKAAAEQDEGGHSSTRVAGSSWRNDQSPGAAGQVGRAVLDALGAVLQLRCADAFQATKENAQQDGGCAAAIKEKSTLFLELFLLVLQAADVVLAAAVSTQQPAEAGTSGLLPGVVDALRGGLVGTLLPSCFASALTLPHEDGGVWFGAGVTEPLFASLQELVVQVTRKLGLLVTPGWRVGGLAEGCQGEEATPGATGGKLREAEHLVGARRDEPRDNRAGVISSAEHDAEASVVVNSLVAQLTGESMRSISERGLLVSIALRMYYSIDSCSDSCGLLK